MGRHIAVKKNYEYSYHQGMNWVLYYTLYTVEGILEEEHVNFVLSCRHLCRPSISKTDLLIADQKLLDFCNKGELL